MCIRDRAEVIVSLGQIIDIVITNPGSGYTQPPTVVTAKQFDVIKQRGRKFDSFVTLNISTELHQPTPTAVFTTIDAKKTQFIESVGGFVLSSPVDGVSVVTLHIDRNIDVSNLVISKEILFNRIRSEQRIESPTEQSNAEVIVNLELDRSIESQPTLTVIFEATRKPLIATIASITYTFAQYETGKFMDTGDILSTGGFPVSKVTIEELGYFDISAEGEMLNPDREFNLAYPSINRYLTQLDTSELPVEGGAGYLATNEVVYANTNNFPSSGTILVGREKISYTNKLSDRFLGCTRGVDGTPIEYHALG